MNNNWIKAWMGFNIAATVIWLLLGWPTLLWWKDDIAWVAWMSLWANFASHLAAWMALISAKNERKDFEKLLKKLNGQDEQIKWQNQKLFDLGQQLREDTTRREVMHQEHLQNYANLQQTMHTQDEERQNLITFIEDEARQREKDRKQMYNLELLLREKGV